MKPLAVSCPCWLATVALSISVAEAAPLKFAFGRADTPAFAGFTRVSDKTVFTPSSSFGFVAGTPSAYDRVRPNALEGGFILSKTASTFRVNLADGDYKAWFLYGDSRNGVQSLVDLAKLNRIEINGAQALSDPLMGWKDFYSEKYFFRGYSYVYHNNSDFYAKYVAPNFKEATAAFQVRDGKALFTFEDIPLCAMIVYPASEAQPVEDDIAYLHKELRRNTIIQEVKPDGANPQPHYSLQDTRRGYVVYSRFPTNPPLPYDRPLDEELHLTPNTFLAAGQTAELSLTVLPLTDLTNVKINCSALKDKQTGAELAAGAVTTNYVSYQERNEDASRTMTPVYKYKVVPQFIKPLPPVFDLMDRGINRTFLLSVTADKSTRPGIYEGAVEIAPLNKPLLRVPVKVRVLPFTLPELPIVAGRYDFDSCFFYNYYWQKVFTDDSFVDYVWQRQKANMAWSKSMGMNSLAFSDDMRGDVLQNPGRLKDDSRFIRWMDLYRDMGFKVMPWYGFQSLTTYFKTADGSPRFGPEWTANYRALIANVRDLGKKRGWPEVLFYLSDELSNEGAQGGVEGLNRIAASDGIEGIRRIASANGIFEHPMIGKIEILMPNFAFPITQKVLDEFKAKNTTLWIYNVGDLRYTWGYYPFRIGAKGRFQWYNSYGQGYPFDDFDGYFPDSTYSVFFAGPNGPVGVIGALNMRDGLDDLRYLTLLERLVAQNKHPDTLAMRHAQGLLAEVKALDVDLRDNGDGQDARAATIGAGTKMWSDQTCERMRWRVADCIMALQHEPTK